MKKYILLVFFSIFINEYYSNKINYNNIINELENTIEFEIKTLNYENEKEFDYYLNANPHVYNHYSDKKKNKNKFINFDLILNNIYTNFSIGTPSQYIIGFFSCKLNTFNIFYSIESNSISFKNLYKNDKIEKCSENFEFKYQNNSYEIKDMEFIKAKYSSFPINISHGFLGLQISSKDVEKMRIYHKNNNQTEINFIESLKNSQCKNLNISNYYWTIKYFDSTNNNIDGIFYFGEPPHIFDPINYSKEDLIEINTEAGYDNLYWGLKFDSIDLINKTTNEIITKGKYSSKEYSLIYPEINYFLTTEEFFSRIKTIFFSKFIFKKKSENYNSSICYETFASIVDNIDKLKIEGYMNEFNGIYDMFYCNKTKIEEYGEEKFYNQFPLIKFDHLLLGYSFEFEAKDLFFEKEGNVYFLMALKVDRGGKWVFGKTFMKKYQIIFNNDMRTLGFYLKEKNHKKYTKPNEIIIYDDQNRRKNYLLIVIIACVLIFTCLFLIRIFCIKNRIWIFKDKKTAEELELLNNTKEIMI